MIHLDFKDVDVGVGLPAPHIEKVPIAVLRIDQGPGTGNRFDLDLVNLLSQRLTEVVNSSARAAVLTGTGSTFIDGLDLKWLVGGGQKSIKKVIPVDEAIVRIREFVPAISKYSRKEFTLPVPLVAAINGSALSAGSFFAAGCDWRVMTNDSQAVIGLGELQAGIPPPIHALEMLLPLLSAHNQTDLIYNSRFLSADDALKAGLVDEVAEPANVLSQAEQAAGKFGLIPGYTFALIKQTIRQPIVDRMDRYFDEWVSKVIEIWSKPQSLAVLRFIAGL